MAGLRVSLSKFHYLPASALESLSMVVSPSLLVEQWRLLADSGSGDQPVQGLTVTNAWQSHV